MPRYGDINLAISKANAEEIKAKEYLEKAKDKYKKAVENVARLVMIKNGKKIENLQAAVENKGLSLDDLITAINSGNFDLLKETAETVAK